VVKDGTTHPVDIMLDIFTEVGLGEAVHQESFELAKSLTPEYAVGVCFENIPPVRPCGRFCGGPSMTSGLISGRSKSGPIWGRTRLMARIDWARSSQFNWVYDNLGGTPLMAAVAGKADQATALVQADGSVRIDSPNPGGGQVYFVRGVWRQETSFAWDGFWAEPMDGNLTNYYLGGSFSNEGGVTVLTLGTPLAAGTAVQLFYVYLTGETSEKYAALNNYPCIRRAYRGREDYTYDFAVDRMLDLMVYLHLAGRERGEDFSQACQFLWDEVLAREASATSPFGVRHL
jgi:hypothetical protein